MPTPKARSSARRRVRRGVIGLISFAMLLVVGLFAAVYVVEAWTNRPLPAVWKKVQDRWEIDYPSVFRLLAPIAERVVPLFDDSLAPASATLADLTEWSGRGADADYSPVAPSYTVEGQPLPLAEASRGTAAFPPSRTLRVADVPQLFAALADARAGDQILVQPGTYHARRRRIRLGGAGTPTAPIVVRAARLGDVRFEFDSLEGLYVDQPFWVFENLDIGGVCEDDGECEHAFHVVGKGDSTIIRNNRLHDFNAMIKVNGKPGEVGTAYPDDGLIEGNSFYNRRPRETSNPVTQIDIVAADDWRITRNFLADFARASAERPSYGAFIKGNASGGLMDGNLVVCALNIPLGDTSRVGLSLGGGGTTQEACRDQRCPVESRLGRLINNIVMHCSDVGIYLNKAEGALVLNNTVYNTWGIDARFPETDATIGNNVYTGRIARRDGATVLAEQNVHVDGDGTFRDGSNGDFSLFGPGHIVDQGATVGPLTVDFCGESRGASRSDIGAIEYVDGKPTCDVF